MIKINNARFPVGYTDADIRKTVLDKLKLKSIDDVVSYKILRESLDSRRHDDIHYVITIGVKGANKSNEEKIVKKVNNKNIMLTNEIHYSIPHIVNTEIREFLDIANEFRPVIIGSGPAGYHAAIKLAYAGLKPIVIERGKPVEERIRDVEDFWNGDSSLNLQSNVCYGEGGAGTFSDGKLNTGNKDKGGYFKEVLETFVKYGADDSILYKAKPHIGTDVLRDILKNMRDDIQRLGGEIRFENTLLDINTDTAIETFGYESELPIYELTIDSLKGIYKLKTHTLVLATGHSARDTYEMLVSKDFEMEQKPFALGIRVEHSSEAINEAMYGDNYKELYGDKLPTADYKLVAHVGDRSVFSFCMCPGGYVVNSSTEEGRTCINGMSYSGRKGTNSNSAIVVNITPEDYKSDDILAGIEFQRNIERLAYEEGSGSIPVQLYKDFMNNKVSVELGSVKPEIKGTWTFGDLHKVLPEFVSNTILEAMPEFGRKIKGYDTEDTVFSAVEARTSSPVRINRDEKMMAVNFPGIVPTGEGAGYAGGITSAAADGIKASEAVSEFLIEDLINCYMKYETGKYL